MTDTVVNRKCTACGGSFDNLNPHGIEVTSIDTCCLGCAVDNLSRRRCRELEAENARLKETLSQVERQIDERIIALEERNAAQARVAELEAELEKYTSIIFRGRVPRSNT